MTNDLLDAIERVKTLSPELQSNAARVLIDFADHCDTPSIQLTDAQLAEVQIARQELRNTVEGGHRLRWKADTRMVIADT